MGGGGDDPRRLVRHSSHHVRGADLCRLSEALANGRRPDLTARVSSESPSDIEVRQGVAELAARLGDRPPELVSAISASPRDDIPELRE